MSGVDRDKLRKLHSSEYFTPIEKVNERLDAYNVSVWEDKSSQFIDPTCGDGQFLSEVLIRKLEHGVDFETALSTIYGVDLMPDNVKLCQDRLLCGQEHLRHIVERNIVCHDALTYDYSFNGTSFTDAELREQELGIPAPIKKPKKAKPPKQLIHEANPDLWTES